MVARRLSRLVALLLAAAVVGSPIATCLVLASTDSEMACCVKGTGDCVPGVKTADCCTKSTVQLGHQATATAKFMTPLSQPSLVAAVSDSLILPPTWQPHPFADGLSPPGSKHPTYLVLSTFRI